MKLDSFYFKNENYFEMDQIPKCANLNNKILQENIKVSLYFEDAKISQ